MHLKLLGNSKFKTYQKYFYLISPWAREKPPMSQRSLPPLLRLPNTTQVGCPAHPLGYRCLNVASCTLAHLLWHQRGNGDADLGLPATLPILVHLEPRYVKHCSQNAYRHQCAASEMHLGSEDTTDHHHAEDLPAASPLRHPLRSDRHEKNASSRSLCGQNRAFLAGLSLRPRSCLELQTAGHVSV